MCTYRVQILLYMYCKRVLSDFYNLNLSLRIILYLNDISEKLLRSAL